MSLLKTSSLLACTVLLCACVVKPTVTTDYDQACQIETQKVELSVEQLAMFHQLHCSNTHQCRSQFVGQIVGAALIFPLSAIVSGSIAVVGNTLYWLNEKGQCLKNN